MDLLNLYGKLRTEDAPRKVAYDAIMEHYNVDLETAKRVFYAVIYNANGKRISEILAGDPVTTKFSLEYGELARRNVQWLINNLYLAIIEKEVDNENA